MWSSRWLHSSNHFFGPPEYSKVLIGEISFTERTRVGWETPRPYIESLLQRYLSLMLYNVLCLHPAWTIWYILGCQNRECFPAHEFSFFYHSPIRTHNFVSVWHCHFRFYVSVHIHQYQSFSCVFFSARFSIFLSHRNGSGVSTFAYVTRSRKKDEEGWYDETEAKTFQYIMQPAIQLYIYDDHIYCILLYSYSGN